MYCLYTPTTSFEIVSFEEIDAVMATLKIQKIGCYHDFLQHELYGSELVAPPLCTRPDKMHDIAQITAP
jgi:hypothetical protein